MLLFDYDRSGIETAVLPAGSTFQPWEPEAHWRGEKVPITLGRHHAGFDWGVTSGEGHFLRWDDFFTHCEPEAVTGTGLPIAPDQTKPEPEHPPMTIDHAPEAPDPFASIAAMRLRRGERMRRIALAAAALDNLFEAAAALKKTRDYAANMQLGAEGFDNTESARYYNRVRESALAAAHALLETCQGLLQ